MKKLFVILLLLVTLNATAQNKTVVLKVASVDANNYLTKADSLSGGYTTWLLTKKKIDSLGALKVNYTDTAAMMAASPRVNRFLDSLTNVQSRIQTKSPIAGSSSITTVGTLSAGSIPYSLLTGTPSLDYLPLTGGTLTGPLNGTSATFTTGGTTTVRIKGNSTTGFDLQNDAGGAYLWNRDNTSMYFATNNTQRLEIASTGAATFSSRVNVNGAVDDGSTALKVNGAGTFSSSVEATSLKSSNLAGTGNRILEADGSGNITTSGTILEYNRYIPTLSNFANTSARSSSVSAYYRIGNQVTVYGQVVITITSNSTSTGIYITLPVSTNLYSGYIAGTCSDGAGTSGAIIDDQTNKRAILVFNSTTTGAQVFYYHFTYEVN